MSNNDSRHQNNLRAILQALPKVELHRHMEGSLRLATLAEIAREHGVDIDSYAIEDLRPLVQMVDDEPNFQTFLAKFTLLRKFYTSKESVMRIAYEAIADCAHDNVQYLELRFNPVAQAAHQGFSFEDVADWVIAATRQAQNDFDIQVRLIVQMGRHEPEYARRLAELAVARRRAGIVALDLAGDEEHYSAQKFVDIIRWAKAQGLHITAHAGECKKCPPENIREAVELLHADRIGHGVQAIRSETIMALLRHKNIPLEICPTSNIQTAAVDRLTRHPLLTFFRHGIPVTINTDDPSISNITLTDEYLVAVRVIGISFSELKTIILNAARAAFLPADERATLVTQLENTLKKFTYPQETPNAIHRKH